MFCDLMLSVVILILSMQGVILQIAIMLIIALRIILLYVIILSVTMLSAIILYINNKCCYADCARYYYADITMLNDISIIL